MGFVDNLVRITIVQAATPVSATQTNVPLLIADTEPGWTDGKVVHSYGSLDELTADGFATDSDTYLYATKLLSGATRPASFRVAIKAGSALVSSDLDAIVSEDNSWYAGIIVKGSDAEILTAAAWFQANNKMLFAASATASNGDATSTSSLAYQLKNESYTRTALMFSPASAGAGIEAAWVGSCISATPGTINWAYQLLAGIPTDTLSTSQMLATVGNPIDEVEGNFANTYTSQYQRGVTLKGTTSGSYIDVVMAEDYLRFMLQADIFNILSGGTKIPFTNKGCAVFEAAVRARLNTCVDLNIIDPNPGVDANGNQLPGLTVTMADVGTLSATDRASRRAPTIYFTCTLSGAVDSVAVQGTVSI